MSGKKLVLGYLENVSSKVFSDFPKEITSLVNNRHGVYALYKGDHLYYVGLATNLKSRVKHHLQDRHAGKWDSFRLYLIHKTDHIKELESLILRIADPKGNRVKGRMPHAENMMPRLRAHIKERQIDDLSSVLNLTRKNKKAPARKIRGKKPAKTAGRQPTLAPYVTKGFELRKVYKGKTYKAFVLADGTVRYDGKIYTSPSHAAVAVTKLSRNGWSFWRFKNASGQWVKLNTLRK
ncbi:MAG: DUF2924 domain-containing protein [Kiritimatiellia bacterium]